MFLPRSIIGHLYDHLTRNSHSLSPPVLILVALETDALCACHILTSLFKRDYIGHKIQPICGYDDLTKVGETIVSKMKKQNGGEGGVVVCLGVGGLVDISMVLGLDPDESDAEPASGVDVWLIDARRPWNLGNVFGGDPNVHKSVPDDTSISRAPHVERGMITTSFKPGQGGVIVYDDGDIEEDMRNEQEAYWGLLEMPDVDSESEPEDSDDESQDHEDDQANGVASSDRVQAGQKRKMRSDEDEDNNDDALSRPRRRRRSLSVGSLAEPRNIYSPAVQQASFSSDRDHSEPPPAQAHGSPIVQVASSAPGAGSKQRALRKRFIKERRKYNNTLHAYYASGASYSEPISSMMYSLVSTLGREDNYILWHTVVGVSSLELYGRSITGVGVSAALDSGGSAGWGGAQGERIRKELRDEVRRLNPLDEGDSRLEASRGESTGTIPTNARSPTDHAIRISPEPRFLMIRHWSLYDSMLHSPYLGSRLHIWSEQGRKRLHKLLAKMGVSLSQCKQNYTHMDMELKKGLRQRLLSYAPVYGLDGLVPPTTSTREGWGFVKCWGWRGCYSALDVGVIIGAILEVGRTGLSRFKGSYLNAGQTVPINGASKSKDADLLQSEEWVSRFWEAYDALDNVDALKQALPIAQDFHRAILRTGTAIIEKRQIRHLKAFRIAVVKEGPDVATFTHPGALTKLALWVGEAIAEQERDQRGQVGKGGRPTPLVMACLNDSRDVYVVVGTGGGGGVIDYAARAKRKVKLENKARKKEEKRLIREQKRSETQARKMDADNEDEDEEESEEEDEDDDDSDASDDDDDVAGDGRNRFGNAFQEVVDETNARVRIDSFENCVVEVKKEDLSQFLESLSMKVVVG